MGNSDVDRIAQLYTESRGPIIEEMLVELRDKSNRLISSATLSDETSDQQAIINILQQYAIYNAERGSERAGKTLRAKQITAKDLKGYGSDGPIAQNVLMFTRGDGRDVYIARGGASIDAAIKDLHAKEDGK